MRNDKIKIDKASKETLDLLEHMPQHKPRYGFYDRLNYRIEHPEEEQQLQLSPLARIVRFVGTPVAVAACIAFGVFIGIDSKETTSSSDLDVLVDTYSLSVSEAPQLFETESD